MNKRIGALWNALGGLSFGGAFFVLLALTNRVLGVESAGVFGIACTTAQMLWLVGLFGVSQYQMTDYEEQFSFNCYARLKLLSSLLMLISCVGSIIVLGYTGIKALLTVLLTFYMLAHSIAELFQNRLFQMNRLDLSGQAQVFRTLFSLACFAIALYWTKNLIIACTVLALTNALAVWLFTVRPCRPFIPGTVEGLGQKAVRPLAVTCLPLFFSLLLMNLLIQMPKYVIEFLDTDRTQGVFNMLFVPAQAINLISGFVYRPMLNDFSVCTRHSDVNGITRMLGRLGLLLIALTVLCGFMSWLCGTQILGALYKSDLSAYRLPLLLIIVGGGIFACCQLMYYTALILRKQRQIFVNYGICTALYVFLCPLFVGHYGITGAALGYVIIHIVLLCGYLLIVGQSIRRMNHA